MPPIILVLIRSRCKRRIFVAVLALALIGTDTHADTAINRPDVKLVLQITIDGLRGDLIQRYVKGFGKDGFRSLLSKGVHYTNAHYQYANTETVKPEDIEWVVASLDSSAKDAGKVSNQEKILPEGISIRMGLEGKDESDLLEMSEVDALFHAAEPRAYIEDHPKVARLFPDYRSTERLYFKKTGIFPICMLLRVKRILRSKTHGLSRPYSKHTRDPRKSPMITLPHMHGSRIPSHGMGRNLTSSAL